MVVFADGFPQFKETETVGVMGLPLAQGANTALLDALRRVEIGLSDLEVDDILAARSISWAASRTSMTMNGGISAACFVNSAAAVLFDILVICSMDAPFLQLPLKLSVACILSRKKRSASL